MNTVKLLLWLSLAKKYEPQIEALVTQAVALEKAIVADVQGQAVAQPAPTAVDPAPATAAGLFGGGRVIGLLIKYAPTIEQMVEEFLAGSGATATAAPPPA